MKFADIVPKHIREIQGYQTGRPVEEVERELGIKGVKLASNENPWGPSPKAVEAMRRYLDNVARYPDDNGYDLRQKLAAHLQVPMEQIILGFGSSDVIAMAYRSLLTPDSEVLTSEGSFIVYDVLAQALGVRLIATPMKEYAFDLPAIAEQITSKTRIIVIANPNNPTGTIVRRDQLREFMNKVPEHVLVIMDQAYFEYVDDPDYPDALEYLREGRTVLITRTFSKAYGLAGLRIGYGISRLDAVETLHKVRMAFNAGSLAQAAALAALDDRDHVEKTVRSNRSELEFLYRELTARGAKYVPSFANFILIDVGRPANDVDAALLRQGVIVRAMAAWGLPTMIRVSVGTHAQNEQFLEAFDKVR